MIVLISVCFHYPLVISIQSPKHIFPINKYTTRYSHPANKIVSKINLIEQECKMNAP